MIHLAGTAAMRDVARRLRREGADVGFVPTMGALHEGHLSLVRRSCEDCAVTVVSIFVNPAQFGPSEDLARYPRDLAKDRAALEALGCDYLFTVEEAEMYPPTFQTWVVPGALAEPLCGASRAGHFRGVTTVVCKLFHLVEPRVAWFGQKDFQQARILQQMAVDLDFDVEVAILPTVRHDDGLACSSRNLLLTEQERRLAPRLHEALLEVRKAFDAGERDPARLARTGRESLAGEPRLRPDYFDVRDDQTLQVPARLGRGAVAAAAAHLGATRLIDNELLGDAVRRLR